MDLDKAIARLYPSGIPQIVDIAVRHGYGVPFLELKRLVAEESEQSIPVAVCEAIRAVCLSRCENEYCLVMHSVGLVLEGFSLAELKALVEFHQLPAFVPRREDWERTIKLISAAFENETLTGTLRHSLRELHDEKTIELLAHVSAFAHFHRFLMQCFGDEFDVRTEPRVLALGAEAESLLAFASTAKFAERPIVTICSMCKDVRTPQGWVPIERMIGEIPGQAQFSHGLCERCLDRLTTL